MSRKFVLLGIGVVACGLIALGYHANQSGNTVPALQSRVEDGMSSAPAAVAPTSAESPAGAPDPGSGVEPSRAPAGVDPLVLVRDARRSLDEQRPAAAESLALVATRIDPQRSSAWNVLGRAQLAQRDLGEAEASFARAVACDSTNAHAWNNLGYVRLQRGAWDEAREALETAVARRGEVAYFHNNLGVAYEHLGKLDLAAGAYRRAIELRPDYPTAVASLARISSRLGPQADELAKSSADSSSALRHAGP